MLKVAHRLLGCSPCGRGCSSVLMTWWLAPLRPSDLRESKEEVVFSHDLALEITSHHFCHQSTFKGRVGGGAVRLHLLKEDTSKNSPKYFKTMTVLFHTPSFFSFCLQLLGLITILLPPPSLHDSQGLGSLLEWGVYVCV